jgi:hypothetical protein
MNINEKIQKLHDELIKSLEQLNEMFKDRSEKDDIRQAIETHIGYIVFLKELEKELLENAEKKFTKEFLAKQFTNIHKSCKLVDEIYHEE